jgi:hypothetical protein
VATLTAAAGAAGPRYALHAEGRRHRGPMTTACPAATLVALQAALEHGQRPALRCSRPARRAAGLRGPLRGCFTIIWAPQLRTRQVCWTCSS